MFPAWRDQAGISPDLAIMAPDLDGKRLELLKEAFPKVARVAFLWQSGWHEGKPGLSQRWRLRPRRWDSNFYRLRCEALTILRAHSHERKGTAPRRSLRPQVDLSILSNAECWTSRQRTGCRRCTHDSEFVEAGGLMSYAPNNTDLWRRAADFVDKILERHQARRPSRRAAEEVRVRRSISKPPSRSA